MNGKDISNASVLARQEAGISHVSEDRMKFGTAPKLSLEDNTISKVYYTDKLKTHGLLDSKKISEFTNRILKEFLVKYDNSKQSIAELSGGNVQKVLLGREIDSAPKVLITAYAVRGLDIGASYKIYDLLNEQKEKGVGVLFVGEDLDVLMDLCDRIIVLCHGEITGIVDPDEVTKEDIGLLMTGKKAQEVDE